jgi:hypothetical protein
MTFPKTLAALISMRSSYLEEGPIPQQEGVNRGLLSQLPSTFALLTFDLPSAGLKPRRASWWPRQKFGPVDFLTVKEAADCQDTVGC